VLLSCDSVSGPPVSQARK